MMKRKTAGKGVLAALLLTAGCGGGSGGTTSPPVGVTPDPAEQMLVIKGRIPLHDEQAEVLLHAGSTTFEGQADANGDFQVEVPRDEISGNPYLVIDMSDAAGRHYSAALAEYDIVVERSGGDGVADVSEVSALDVRALDVAAYASLLQATGGEVPANESAASAAERDAMNMETLFKRAALVELWSTGDLELPTGQDTWELLADDDVLESYLEAQLAAAETSKPFAVTLSKSTDFAALLAGGIDAVMATPDTFETDVAPSDYQVVEVSRSTGALKGLAVAFAADGGGTLVSPAGSHATTWKVDAEGDLVVEPVEPAVINLETDTGGPGGAGFDTQFEIRKIRFSRMRETRFADLLLMTVEYEEQRSDTLDNPAYPIKDTLERFALGIKPGGNPVATADGVVGDWVITGMAINSSPHGYHDQTVFSRQVVNGGSLHLTHDWKVQFADDGTGTIPAAGETFSWSVTPEGVISMVFDDAVELQLSLVQDSAPLATLHAKALMADGTVYANGVYALRLPDAAPTLDAATLSGYHVRFGIDENDVSAWGVLRHTLPLQADERTEVMDDFSSSYLGTWTPAASKMRWYVGTDNNLHVDEINKLTATTSAPDPFCEALLADESCVVMHSYELQPLLDDGDRMYWLESVRWNFANEAEGGVPVVNDNGHLVHAAMVARTFLSYRQQLSPAEAEPAPDITIAP